MAKLNSLYCRFVGIYYNFFRIKIFFLRKLPNNGVFLGLVISSYYNCFNIFCLKLKIVNFTKL
jgi:hypothetical protein